MIQFTVLYALKSSPPLKHFIPIHLSHTFAVS